MCSSSSTSSKHLVFFVLLLFLRLCACYGCGNDLSLRWRQASNACATNCACSTCTLTRLHGCKSLQCVLQLIVGLDHSGAPLLLHATHCVTTGCPDCSSSSSSYLHRLCVTTPTARAPAGLVCVLVVAVAAPRRLNDVPPTSVGLGARQAP